jgi:hypothetical protein
MVDLSRRTMADIRQNISIELGLKAAFSRHDRRWPDRPVARHACRHGGQTFRWPLNALRLLQIRDRMSGGRAEAV